MDLSTLVKMSNTYGSNPAYVLAGGGNTSVKDDTTLYVKGSGTQLATIKAEEFVKMDRARLNKIMKTEYPADDASPQFIRLYICAACSSYTYQWTDLRKRRKSSQRTASWKRCALDRYLQTGIHTCTYLF